MAAMEERRERVVGDDTKVMIPKLKIRSGLVDIHSVIDSKLFKDFKWRRDMILFQ